MTRLACVLTLVLGTAACGSVPLMGTDGGGDDDDDAGTGNDGMPGGHTTDDLVGTWDLNTDPMDPTAQHCTVTFTAGGDYDVLCPDRVAQNVAPNCDRTQSDGHIAGRWDATLTGVVESIETYVGSGCVANMTPPGTTTTPIINMDATRPMTFAEMGFFKNGAGHWDWTGSDPMGMEDPIACGADIHANGMMPASFTVTCAFAVRTISGFMCTEQDVNILTGTINPTQFNLTAGGETRYAGADCAMAGHPNPTEPFTSNGMLTATKL